MSSLVHEWRQTNHLTLLSRQQNLTYIYFNNTNKYEISCYNTMSRGHQYSPIFPLILTYVFIGSCTRNWCSNNLRVLSYPQINVSVSCRYLKDRTDQKQICWLRIFKRASRIAVFDTYITTWMCQERRVTVSNIIR